MVNFICSLVLLCMLSASNNGLDVAFPTARAFEMNQKFKFHPMVLQDNAAPAGNASNPLGYAFQDYTFYI